MACLQACRGEKEEKGEEKRKKEGRRGGTRLNVPSIQNYVTYLMANMTFVHVAPIEV